MDGVPQQPMPKKSCMVTIMFPIDSNEEAMAAKEYFDNAVREMKEKRYTFQIVET